MDPLLLGTVAQAGQNLQDNVFAGVKGLGGILYNEFQYGRQKRDNLAFWRMQNEYNSPVAQMKRLQDAGLNPNLIYGRGAGAVGEASPPKPPEPTRSDMPEFRSGVSPFFAGYDLQMKQAQTDNLRQQNTVLLEEAQLKRAQTMDTLASARRKTFDYDIESALKETTLEFRRGLLRQQSAEIDVLLDRNEREAALNSSSLREAAQRILNMREQKMTSELENRLRRLDLELYEQYKIRPGDPYWLRMLAETLERYLSDGGPKLRFFPKQKKGSSW